MVWLSSHLNIKLFINVLSFNDPQYYLTKILSEVKFIRYDENTYSIHVTEGIVVRDQRTKVIHYQLSIL